MDENNKNNVENTDVKPVKLSRGATTALLVVGVFIIMILVITIRSCTIEQKQGTNGGTKEVKNSVSTPISNIIESSTNYAENNSQNLVISNDVTSTSNDNSISVNSNIVSSVDGNVISSVNSEVVSNTISDDNMLEVAQPELSKEIESKGIVLSKHSYLYKNSYIYGITISVMVGDKTQSVQYFCPKKTFDSIESVDTVNVIYQMDSNGVVSITSISK